MNILHIWEGKNEMEKERVDAIAKTHVLYPDSKFLFMTKGTSIFDYQIILNWEKEKRKMLKFYGLSSLPKEWESYMPFSDWFRFYFLINNPGTLFLDTDCWMNNRFDFENQDRIINPENEICLLYAPKNNSFLGMKKILDRHIELKCFGILLGLCGYLKKNMNSLQIDPIYFSHK